MAAGVITEIAGGSITTSTAGDLSLYAQNVDLAASDRVNWKGEDNGVNLGTDPKDPDEGKVLVKTAYFAKKVERKVKTVETQDYTVKAGDTHASIAKSVPGVHVKELKRAHPKLKPGASILLKVHRDKKEFILVNIDEAIFGTKVFVVVETVGLQGESVDVEILGSNNPSFIALDEPMRVLVAGEEKISIKGVIGALASNEEFVGTTGLENKAIIEIQLRPEAKTTFEEWRKKVNNTTEKKAFVHLQTKADTSKEVVYYNEDENILENTADKGIFKNKKNKWLELYFDICTEGVVVNGFIINSKVTNSKIDSCNKNNMIKKVEIIVLHRTAGGKAAGTLSHMTTEGYGAHFIIDNDGTIYQAIGLDKKGSHIGVAQFQSTKDAGWGNDNSIGIETCGYSLDKNENKRIGSKFAQIPHDHWELVTTEQAKSVACILNFLLNFFSLTVADVKVHEELCSKEPREGRDVYDAMLPELKHY